MKNKSNLWKWLTLSGVAFLLSCLLPGCNDTEESGTERVQVENEQITIGFSVATDTFIIERWNKDIRIFNSAAGDLGAKVIIQMSAGGTQAQIDQIHYMLDQNIDVLVILPHDTEKVASVIKTAHSQNIPVIAYDRLIQGVPVDAYVSFDNEEVGRLFGRALTQAVPQGNYLIVNGSVHDNNSYLVNQGLYEILTPYINKGSIHIVDEIWLEAWSGDEARMRISRVLERTTDIDAISAANDQIADSAIRLLSERRIAENVAVVGQDADLVSAQRVVEGLQLMTVYKPIQRLATRAAELAVAMAKGTLPEPDSYMENGSEAPIPFFVETPYAVYSWNMDETIIRDGFHSAEDVYRMAEKDPPIAEN